MKTKKLLVKDIAGNSISNSKALLWGNNAAWVCVDCEELLANRTGDTEYLVECSAPTCTAKYEIERGETKNGGQHLGPSIGIRKIA